MDLYLRISLELHLKRLCSWGLERVYEIGRNFRNEGVGWKYNPEFTMLELYRAYADYETMMDVTRDLVQASALAVAGSLEVSFRGHEIDLGGEWRRVTVLGSVSEAVEEEVTLERPDLAELAERHDVPVDPSWPAGKIALELFEKLVEPGLIQPTFVCDFPREVSPLARPHRDDPRLTEHVDPVIGGMELGTGYSELTDPDEQRAKFLLQQQAREAGELETHPFDEDFLQALEHGMPPAGAARDRGRPAPHAARRRGEHPGGHPVPAAPTSGPGDARPGRLDRFEAGRLARQRDSEHGTASRGVLRPDVSPARRGQASDDRQAQPEARLAGRPSVSRQRPRMPRGAR